MIANRGAPPIASTTTLFCIVIFLSCVFVFLPYLCPFLNLFVHISHFFIFLYFSIFGYHLYFCRTEELPLRRLHRPPFFQLEYRRFYRHETIHFEIHLYIHCEIQFEIHLKIQYHSTLFPIRISPIPQTRKNTL